MTPPAAAGGAADRPVLVVNADDYGLTDGVSRGILEGAERGVITSVSVLTLGPGFASSAGLLAGTGLGVGAHLAAVGEDPPLLGASEIPSLVDARGRLAASWRQFLPRAALGRIDPDDLRREFTAQLEAVRGAGLVVDHLDTHQNLHLWPMVRDVVLDVGEAADVRVVRVTRSRSRGPIGVVVRRLARDLERRLDARGWRYPAASTGLDEAGGLDVGAMVTAVGVLGDAIDRGDVIGREDVGGRGAADGAAGAGAELATHPGRPTAADRQRYAWDYRWDDELDALCSPEVREAIDAAGFRLGTFADLAPGG